VFIGKLIPAGTGFLRSHFAQHDAESSEEGEEEAGEAELIAAD